MELASIMQELSFRKKPRNGQAQVLEAVLDKNRSHLNIQLPTGYGKTFTAYAAYSILCYQGRVNRLLYITANNTQLNQFSNEFEDMHDAGVPLPHKIRDFSFFDALADKEHRRNECHVFATNIQALMSAGGIGRVNDLLATGQWMVVVDEYHHYGETARWGATVLKLNCAYRLAMSATPGRKDDDSAFGDPDVKIRYNDAVKEKAVKPLFGHSYTYRIDAINEEGEIISYTTSELKEEMGEGDKLEKARIKNKMRWSPRYISPLVSIPLERMISKQLETGHRLQAILGAMCVSHAKLVCEQVKGMFPELSVDWVGTGENGRKPAENEAILKKFCPKKDDDGRRNHTLDVLVHVGMAGEGLDARDISEVVHLNPANVNNSNNQENGRAARYLEGVEGNINFDSCSEYAGYVGEAIMDAMDSASVCSRCGKLPCECKPAEEPGDGIYELPEVPTILLTNMELIHIDSGSPDVRRTQEMMLELPSDVWGGMTKENMNDPEYLEIAIDWTKARRRHEAERFNEKALVEQWKHAVNKAVGQAAGTAIKLTFSAGSSVPQSFAGDFKKRINQKKKQHCGPIINDIDVCKKHYEWVWSLQQQMIHDGVPLWLK